MSTCDPNEPCEKCGRTLEDIAKKMPGGMKGLYDYFVETEQTDEKLLSEGLKRIKDQKTPTLRELLEG